MAPASLAVCSSRFSSCWRLTTRSVSTATGREAPLLQQQPRASVSPLGPQKMSAAAAFEATSLNIRVSAKVLKGHMIMGVMQLILGSAAFTLGIVNSAVGAGNNLTLVGSGIWAGLCFIIAGIAGLVVSCARGCDTLAHVNRCLHVCIVAASLGLSALIIEAIVTAGNRRIFENPNYHYYPSGSSVPFIYANITNVAAFRTVYGTSIACCVLFALQLVLAIAHTVCVFLTAGELFRRARITGTKAGQQVPSCQGKPASYPDQPPSYPADFGLEFPPTYYSGNYY